MKQLSLPWPHRHRWWTPPPWSKLPFGEYCDCGAERR